MKMSTQHVPDMFNTRHIGTKCLPMTCLHMLLIQKDLHYFGKVEAHIQEQSDQKLCSHEHARLQQKLGHTSNIQHASMPQSATISHGTDGTVMHTLKFMLQ